MSDSPTGLTAPSGLGTEPTAQYPVGLPAVLLVDDQPARLLSCEAVLSALPIRCVRALSGELALAALLRERFAAIVLDVNMPIMDGFETARLIRGHHRFQRTPILFLTGVHLTEADYLKGYEVGAIDYLPIPIAPEILRSKIAILVELDQRRGELEELTRALVSARYRLQALSGGLEYPTQTAHPDKSAAIRPYDDLLLVLSHELRNALAPMLTATEIVLMQTEGIDPRRLLLEMIRDYGLRISGMADVLHVRPAAGEE